MTNYYAVSHGGRPSLDDMYGHGSPKPKQELEHCDYYDSPKHLNFPWQNKRTTDLNIPLTDVGRSLAMPESKNKIIVANSTQGAVINNNGSGTVTEPATHSIQATAAADTVIPSNLATTTTVSETNSSEPITKKAEILKAVEQN